MLDAFLAVAFLGCPNPTVQLYMVAGRGIIEHALDKRTNVAVGEVRYLDLDDSVTTIYLVREKDKFGDWLYWDDHVPSFKGTEWFCKIDLNREHKWEIEGYEYRPEVLP